MSAHWHPASPLSDPHPGRRCPPGSEYGGLRATNTNLDPQPYSTSKLRVCHEACHFNVIFPAFVIRFAWLYSILLAIALLYAECY